jgi:hypothetical protein
MCNYRSRRCQAGRGFVFASQPAHFSKNEAVCSSPLPGGERSEWACLARTFGGCGANDMASNLNSHGCVRVMQEVTVADRMKEKP